MVIDGGSTGIGGGDVLVRPGDGEPITKKERRDVAILAERELLTATWSRYAAGERGPDLHVHREHTDAFYVLDGELTFTVGSGAERIRVPAGGFVAVPPHVVHTFVNQGPAEAASSTSTPRTRASPPSSAHAATEATRASTASTRPQTAACLPQRRSCPARARASAWCPGTASPS
jgi:quercetin dioxygenase-like cupin family protein